MIKKGKKVQFHYNLEVEGRQVDSSREGEPLQYVHGRDNLIPGLQQGLEGRAEGETCTIEVEPDQAYGPVREEAIIEVPKDKIPSGEIKPGTPLEAAGTEGQPLRGIVKDVRPETVIVDFNHPLAGKTLRFDVEILKVAVDL